MGTEQHRTGRLVVGSGARVLQQGLMAELEALRPTTPAELEPPVRVIVPSASLRRHLMVQLVRQGRARVGVVVQSLFALALEVCERMGDRPRPAEQGWELIARRLAADEPALTSVLAHLRQGYAPVWGAVRDLLDAGLEPAHCEPLLEQLETLPEGAVAAATIERAMALVRAAAGTFEQAAQLGLWRTSEVLRRAVEHVCLDPEAALPARAVLVYGFADVTGRAGDLLESLARHRSAAVFLELPPDPFEPGGVGPEHTWTKGMLEKILLAGASQQTLPRDEAGDGTQSIELVSASTRDAEVRAAAARLQKLLEEGVSPESLSVVARDLTGYAPQLRRHLDRLGVPFSGVGAQVPEGAVRRRARALGEVLRQGAQAPADVWLDAVAAVGEAPGRQLVADARLALRARGVLRLGDVAGADTSPAERADGLGGAPDELQDDSLECAEIQPQECAEIRLSVIERLEGEGSDRPHHRVLATSHMEAMLDRARRCLELLEPWPEQAETEAHLEQTVQVATTLGWLTGDGQPGVSGPGETLAAIEAAAEVLPASMVLSRAEWLDLVGSALEKVGSEPIGGRGGGVQVLSVMEARGMVHPHLLVLGLNRDVFPRIVRDDPLLPDPVRARMAEVLPDIPIKARGWLEERYLFSQLVASSPRVVLSMHRQDRGRPMPPSPFIDRMRLERGIVVVELGADLGDAVETGSAPGLIPPVPAMPLMPAFEHAIRLGLAGRREAWTGALALALEEGRERAGRGVDRRRSELVAEARREVLEEVDPSRRLLDPGAFAGFLGAAPIRVGRALPVTTLERLAVCPWQAFVTRCLHVAGGVPDRFEPPSLDARLVGTVVHAVLQTAAELSGVLVECSLDAARVQEGRGLAWPEPRQLEALLLECSGQALASDGLGGLGLAVLVAAAARPYLDVARSIDQQAEPRPEVVGAEATGELAVGVRTLRFRADRVDRRDEAARLIDYKTGSILARDKRTEKGRRDALLKEIAAGRLLQAAVYAMAGGPGAVGEYRYLAPDPDIEDEAVRRALVDIDDVVALGSAQAAVTVLLAAWEAGVAVPRVETAGKPGASEQWWCRTCRVRQACFRDDSGFRRRLAEWMQARPPDPTVDLAHAEGAAAAVWWIGLGPVAVNRDGTDDIAEGDVR